ncbi:MAG: hypothetical protein P1P90_04290 [Patescibacteria group bacterium]|nr:hypothetical protein [Patescibacteria group bacterium]
MTRSEANAIFSNFWCKGRKEDSRLQEAISILGIKREDLLRFSKEADKVQRGMPRCMVLTPTSVGRRR